MTTAQARLAGIPDEPRYSAYHIADCYFASVLDWELALARLADRARVEEADIRRALPALLVAAAAGAGRGAPVAA